MESVGDENLAGMLERVQAGLREYQAGEYVMTDDKAPVEVLGMRVIDELIRDEVAYYQGIYEEGGVRGLLDSF